MKISIVIPVYNERRTLDRLLQRVAAAPLPAGCEREVIVVDDGSTDGSGALVDEQRARGLAVAHYSIVHAGKGAALRAGIARATGEIVLVQDGDLEYDPGDYLRILAPIVDGSADVVYGSRFMPAVRAANVKGMKWPNWIANRILTATANILFNVGITDEATAYKAFRAEVIRSVRLRAVRFEFCPEVTAKLSRLGYRIHEVAIGYSARGIEEGKKIRWQDGVEAFWTLLKYRFTPRRSFTADSSARQVSAEAAR